LIGVLRKTLVKIHPLDYEKIRFVCTWLVDLLSEDEFIDTDNDVDLDDSSISSGGITCNLKKKTNNNGSTTTRIAEIETCRYQCSLLLYVILNLLLPSKDVTSI